MLTFMFQIIEKILSVKLDKLVKQPSTILKDVDENVNEQV